MRANCYEVFVSALLEWSAFPALILSAGTLRFPSWLESGSGVWPGLHAGEMGPRENIRGELLSDALLALS